MKQSSPREEILRYYHEHPPMAAKRDPRDRSILVMRLSDYWQAVNEAWTCGFCAGLVACGTAVVLALVLASVIRR